MDRAPPVFRFTPTQEELIRFYLDPWVADPGKTPVSERQGIVCVTDIYDEDPAALTSRHRRFGHNDGNWYFLCVARWKGNRAGGRASRTVNGGGTWHGYGKRVAVADAGHRQAFEYLDARGRKTAWLMEEFGTVLPAATGGDGVRVLCRVHQTTRTAEDEERWESSKAARSSKRQRRGEHDDIAADVKDELKPLEMFTMEEDKPEPLEHVLAKDEPESWEILAMEDEAEPWEMVTMEDVLEPWEMLMLTNKLTSPQEMLTNNLPWPLEMLTNNLTWPQEIFTNNMASPLETRTKNLPEPVETVAKNDLPSPLEILIKNLPEPLDNLAKEDEPEPVDAEAPTTTTSGLNRDSDAANKEATPNAEMEMPAHAEWHYPELFEQQEPPSMEDVMKPLPAPTVQEFEQGTPPAAISLAWLLPGF